MSYWVEVDGDTTKHKSLAWKHFKVSSAGDCTKCNHCDAMLTYSTGGTTSNMLKHLRSRHKHLSDVGRLLERRRLAQVRNRMVWVSSCFGSFRIFSIIRDFCRLRSYFVHLLRPQNTGFKYMKLKDYRVRLINDQMRINQNSARFSHSCWFEQCMYFVRTLQSRAVYSCSCCAPVGLAAERVRCVYAAVRQSCRLRNRHFLIFRTNCDIIIAEGKVN